VSNKIGIVVFTSIAFLALLMMVRSIRELKLLWSDYKDVLKGEKS
jgi:hypothetical protein